MAGLDENTKLLMHMDGSDDGTTFPDSSTENNKGNATVTATVVTKTGVKKWGTASALFDGDSGHLTYADSVDWDICGDNSDDWTIDFWFKCDGSTYDNLYWLTQGVDSSNRLYFAQYDYLGNRYIAFSNKDAGSGGNIYLASPNDQDLGISDTNWHHLALCKVGSLYGIYLDGVQLAFTDDSDICTQASALYIGKLAYAANFFPGYMEELRIQGSNYFEALPNVGLTNTITVPTEAYSPPVTEKFASDSGSGVDAKLAGNPVATITKGDSGGGVDVITQAEAILQGTESGSGIEAILDRDLGRPDSGIGTEALVSLLADLAKSDSGAGVDSLLDRLITLVDSGIGIEALLGRDFASVESGAGIDTSSLLASLIKADSGIGAEALISLLAALAKSDSGTGIESIVSRAIALADLGTGTDISSLVVTLLKTDIGSGLDSSVLEALISKAETGSGIDALEALSVALSKTDTGTGTEAILSRAFALVESGIGAEASALLASLTDEDVAIASEIAQLISALASSEVGTGSEAVISRLLTLLDTGTGSDVAITLGLMATDSGVGSEAIISRLMTLADSGTGLEVATRLGRLLRLIIITSLYRDLNVVTTQNRFIKIITTQYRQL